MAGDGGEGRMIDEIATFAFFCLCAWLWSKYRRARLREELTAAALAGLLANHKDHAEECREGETCPQAVARLAVELADETIKRLERS